MLCYADHLLIMAGNILMQSDIKRGLVQLLPANHLGEAAHYLGVKIIRREDSSIPLLQQKLVE